MTQRDHFADDAAGIASLDGADPELVAARAHAMRCARCAVALRNAEDLIAIIGGAPPPEPRAETLQRSFEKLQRTIAERERRSRMIVVSAVPLAWGVALLLATARTHWLDAWIESVAVLCAAFGVAVLAHRPGPSAAPLALGASTIVALTGGSDEGLFLLHGIKCIGIELLAAAIPFGALATVAVRWGDPGNGARFAAVAAAGALAGQGALLVTCPELARSSHLLATHVTGVMLAALIGALGQRVLARRLPLRVDVPKIVAP